MVVCVWADVAPWCSKCVIRVETSIYVEVQSCSKFNYKLAIKSSNESRERAPFILNKANLIMSLHVSSVGVIVTFGCVLCEWGHSYLKLKVKYILI